MDTKTKGYLGEELAERLLKSHKYKILERNFKCNLGEIDMVALKDDILIFIEVKMRSSYRYGLPEEAVTAAKVRKITLVSDYYRKTHGGLPKKSRIDVVAIDIQEGVVKSTRIIPVV